MPSAPMPTTTIIAASSATPLRQQPHRDDRGPAPTGSRRRCGPLASARAVAAATCAGVLDSGAGVMPSVIRPITNPGRDEQQPDPVPCSASVRPLANPSSPALAEP